MRKILTLTIGLMGLFNNLFAQNVESSKDMAKSWSFVKTLSISKDKVNKEEIGYGTYCWC